MNDITRTFEYSPEVWQAIADRHANKSKSKYDYHAGQWHQVTGNLDYDPHFDHMDDMRLEVKE